MASTAAPLTPNESAKRQSRMERIAQIARPSANQMTGGCRHMLRSAKPPMPSKLPMISNEYALSGGSLRNSVPRSAPRGTKKSAQRAKSITTTGMIGISFVGTPAHQTPHRNSFGSLGTVMRIMLKNATVPTSMKPAGMAIHFSTRDDCDCSSPTPMPRKVAMSTKF